MQYHLMNEHRNFVSWHRNFVNEHRNFSVPSVKLANKNRKKFILITLINVLAQRPIIFIDRQAQVQTLMIWHKKPLFCKQEHLLMPRK
jgi:hypothetical protein